MSDLDLFASSILVVDDLNSARKVLCRLLNNLGYFDISQAKDGEEALEQLRTRPFDLIISDWEMPRMKGIELLRIVREDPDLNKLAFIMITSNGSKDGVKEAADLNVSDYLTKPFDLEILGRKLTEILSANSENTDQ